MTNGNSAERERFEDWFKKPHGLPLTSTTARVMWEAWQARAALSVCADGGKGEAVAWRDVVKAIRAVDSEAARRGEMYPQTRDDQRDDRVATRRVCEMIEWYATKGGAVAESLDDWPKLTAPQAECAPRDRASSMPGGCECSTCGRVFIGGPAHSECGECAPRADRSVDSTYIAGMKAGYNFGVLEDNAGMQKCIEQRLKDIRESRLEVQAECAPREAQPVAWRVVAMRPNAIMKWAAFCQHHEALNCAKQWPEQIPYLASCVIEVQPLYTAPTPDVTGMRTLVHQIVALEPLKHPDNMENAVRILSRVIAAPTPERAQESAGVPLLVCSETIREAILRRDMHACGLAYGLASLARSILDADKEPQP
jgi:hypothetical protein